VEPRARLETVHEAQRASHPAPGPWLRLSALAAAIGPAVVVATGEWDRSHQAAVLGTLALTLGVAVTVWLSHRDRPALVAAASVALALLCLEIALGGLVALTDATWLEGLHVALGAISLAASIVTCALTLRPSASLRPHALPWRDYITLTKPRIMVLLLLTATAGIFVGERGVPSLGLVAATLGGLALACGGASALNHVLDADIDQHMSRTDRRPVATGRIAPERALEFGLALSAFSFVVLTSFVNVLAALLAVFGNLFYVLVYTRWLKRTTPQNIVIGGAAGAIPAVVGWAAATGNLALPALFLFLIVFYWTPPHFWALALLIRRDYEAAKVPMLPVVRGDRMTAASILRYTVLLVGITLLPFLFGELSWVYLGAAAVLGAGFLALAVLLLRDTSPARARSVFSYSLSYLALLFVAMAIDPIVLG
jgi:heme o synthase